MRESPRIQPYLSANYDTKGAVEGFDVSFNHGDISFQMLEMTPEEVGELALDILTQLELIMETEKLTRRPFKSQ